MKKDWGAPQRNAGPILAALDSVLGEGARVFELASGTGQHAFAFTQAKPRWTWWPSDPDPENLASIEAWRNEGGPGFRQAVRLDVTKEWPALPEVDAIFCANVMHITPFDVTLALFDGARRALAPGQSLICYGPFKRGGAFSSDGDARFDADLRARDRSWGIRDLEAVIEAAGAAGFAFVERRAMPANNHFVIFRAT